HPLLKIGVCALALQCQVKIALTQQMVDTCLRPIRRGHRIFLSHVTPVRRLTGVACQSVTNLVSHDMGEQEALFVECVGNNILHWRGCCGIGLAHSVELLTWARNFSSHSMYLSRQGVGSIDTRSGRAILVSETSACPGARPGSMFHWL